MYLLLPKIQQDRNEPRREIIIENKDIEEFYLHCVFLVDASFFADNEEGTLFRLAGKLVAYQLDWVLFLVFGGEEVGFMGYALDLCGSFWCSVLNFCLFHKLLFPYWRIRFVSVLLPF